MVYQEAMLFIFKPAVPIISYVLMSLIATLISGSIFIINNKMKNSQFFNKKEKLLIFFVVEIIALSIILQLLSPHLSSLLLTYISLLPAIILEFSVVFYVWFDYSFQFRTNWIIVGLVQIPFALLVILASSGV